MQLNPIKSSKIFSIDYIRKNGKSADFKNINDNRQFWKTFEPFLLHEDLGDQDNVISDDKSLSKEFSNFFNTLVKNLDAKGPQVAHVNEDSDPIDIALKKRQSSCLVYLK